jgi:hypothetical protein
MAGIIKITTDGDFLAAYCVRYPGSHTGYDLDLGNSRHIYLAEGETDWSYFIGAGKSVTFDMSKYKGIHDGIEVWAVCRPLQNFTNCAAGSIHEAGDNVIINHDGKTFEYKCGVDRWGQISFSVDCY